MTAPGAAQPVGRPRAGTFAGAWRHRRWRRLFAGASTSMAADFAFSVVVVVFVLQRTGSPTWVAAVVVARLVPAIVLAPLGGVLADRGNRRRLLVGADASRAVLLTAVAGVAITTGPVVVVVALTAMVGAVAGPYRATVIASTPDLVDVDDLVAANAALSTASEFAWFAGTAGGAALTALAGTGPALVVVAGAFLVAAALTARGAPAASPRMSVASGGLWYGVSDATSTVRGDPGLTTLFLFVATVFFAFGFEQVVHVLVARDRLALGAEGVGVLAAAIGLGAVVGAPVAARVARGRHGGGALAGAGIVVGASLALLAVVSHPVLAVVILTAEGAAGVVFEVLVVTSIQRSVPGPMLATVSSLHTSVTGGAQLVGSMAAPAMVAVASLPVALVLAGAAVAVVAALLGPRLQEMAERADIRRRTLAPIVGVLAPLDLFAKASPLTLERLAVEAEIVPVPAGAIVIREGDVAEAFFVVVDGDFSVVSRGERSGPPVEVNRLSSGDWFGEIGLLQRRRRTATVRAEQDSTVVVIGGEAFVAATTGTDALADPLRRTMAVRLARTHPSAVTDEGEPG